ncbi:MAG: Tat pathway signal sequence [Selenomonadaceae bacterium]|nr:Tat pathway signal sequence [Selenomonadaceae bacterium]
MTDKKLRITMSLVGVILTGISVGIFQAARLGTDPLTCFATALANFFNSTYAICFTIITGILLVAVFFVKRHYIGLATILSLCFIGIMADTTRWLIELVITNPNMTSRIFLMAFAVLLLSFASSLYFTADMGVSSYDAMALMASKDYQLAAFRVCRVTTDLFCVIVGFMGGADIGIGTVITAFMMGPFVQWFNEHFSEPLLKSKQAIDTTCAAC